MEVFKIERLADVPSHGLRRPEREKSRRHVVPILVALTLPILAATPQAEEEQASRAKRARNAIERDSKIRIWYVQKTVQAVRGVEASLGKIKMEYVGDARVDALAPAQLDHGGRQIGSRDIKARLSEERTVLTGTSADLDQVAGAVVTEAVEEGGSFGDLPRLLGNFVPSDGRRDVVRLDQQLGDIVIAHGIGLCQNATLIAVRP